MQLGLNVSSKVGYKVNMRSKQSGVRLTEKAQVHRIPVDLRLPSLIDALMQPQWLPSEDVFVKQERPE